MIVLNILVGLRGKYRLISPKILEMIKKYITIIKLALLTEFQKFVHFLPSL